MKQQNSTIDVIDQIVSDGVQRGILHLYTEDSLVNNNIITLKNHKVVNFGSCSYLGLEFDNRLTEGAIQAIRSFGTQFSESRAYVSVGLYRELETLLENIFGLPVVVTATTTLGHISNIPVLVNDSDAIIMDHQVHHSVQTAVNLAKVKGVHTELLRHNRMDLLEQRILALRGKHKRIWYMADGIYSMFGDTCPVNEVETLLNRYPELHFYADDAHGMSIYGENGKGYVLSRLPRHDRMYLGTSLNKAFASGGGVMVYPNREMARKVRSCGGPMITSGPMQPGNLGAAIAAAKIHLTPEINEMQETLHDNIRFANILLHKYKLPVVSESDAAVFFIGVSLPGLGYNLVKRMLTRGYYLNLGIFPAVPIKNTGIRFTITRLHTFTQIESMIQALSEEFERAMKEEGVTLKQIYKAFRLPLPEETMAEQVAGTTINQVLNLRMSAVKSATELNPEEWNRMFTGKGSFDWNGVQFLENIFTGNKAPEDNWLFDYITIYDNEGQPVVATMLTTGLWKDDMLSAGAVSAVIEQRRFENPYYLTSRVISAGSLLSEGEHIYINRQSPFWKDALLLLIEKIGQLQETYEANMVMLRDFADADTTLTSFFADNGFFRVNMPDTNIVNTDGWDTRAAFHAGLSTRSRKHFMQDVARFEPQFEAKIAVTPQKEEILHWYQLYCNVKNRNFDLNTFTLPFKLFEQVVNHSGWDVLTLHLEEAGNAAVAVLFSYKSGNSYVPMIIGMDYKYLNSHKLYKQCLYQLVMRGKEMGCDKIHLGFSAVTEKKKVGAQQVPVYAFVQVKDDFNLKEIENIAVTYVAEKKQG
jgi:7-keto-8-aminopelargonate synthetase-like enzyme